MRSFCWIVTLGACLALPGCKAQRQDARFEKEFEAAKKQSRLDEVDVISLDKGHRLQTNVQRIGEPTPPKGVEVGESLPPTLGPPVVARVIRLKISRLRYCLLDNTVKGKSGKAVITLTIKPSGQVSDVNVKAPSFTGSSLMSCVRNAALLWRFPRFKKGSIRYSYPVIFRGR